MKRRWVWLGVLVGLVVMLSHPALFSFPKEYRLELTVITDRAEEYVLMVEIDQRAFKRLESDPTGELQSYLVLARREYAVQIGYRPEIYGPENYKMVTIRKSSFVVREISSGRVVLKKG